MAHAMASRPTTLARPGVASSAALRASVRASRVGAFGRFVSTTTTAESGAIRREVLDRAGRAKLNAADDRGWYQVPRMCTHVDDAFLAQLTQLYRERVPPGGRVFDMCSSWISHLPPEVEYEEVVGHGDERRGARRQPSTLPILREEPQREPHLRGGRQVFRRRPVLRLRAVPPAPGGGVRRGVSHPQARGLIASSPSPTGSSTRKPSRAGATPADTVARSSSKNISAPSRDSPSPR